MMKRDAALEVLARKYPDGIVVAVFQSAFDWMVIRPHPLNYLCTGTMGQAASHALGLAIGCPEEKVVVLDGDGSLLMNLGALVTTANAAPKIWYISSATMGFTRSTVASRCPVATTSTLPESERRREFRMSSTSPIWPISAPGWTRCSASKARFLPSCMSSRGRPIRMIMSRCTARNRGRPSAPPWPSVAPPPVEALSGWPGREQPSGSRSGRRAAFLLVGGTQGWNDPYSTSQCEVGIHLLHIFTKDLDELLR